jgi:ABC-2 type transport system permease protein
VSVGLTIGSFIESLSGFQLIGSFLIFPLFFLSGALFPIGGLPSWLSPIVSANPVTYAVDGLRGAILGASAFPLAYDFSVLLVFACIMIAVGTAAFRRMKI